jgi:hypothetical protein
MPARFIAALLAVGCTRRPWVTGALVADVTPPGSPRDMEGMERKEYEVFGGGYLFIPEITGIPCFAAHLGQK